ncbi:MAG: hypothetical protein Q8P71_00195 [bacterium]|nr:hypothetical protein [bacterium]
MQKVVPAILERDKEETRKKLILLQGVSEWVQIDIADGVFVSNRTHGVQDIPEESRKFKTEVHLMVQNPQDYFMACQEIGATRVIFHLSAVERFSHMLEDLRLCTFAWGVALNPNISVQDLSPYINEVTSLLVMSVQPGFQGSLFVPAVLGKIAEVRALKNDILVGVDGGVNKENILDVFKAGANYACVGSSIFGSDNPVETFQKLSSMVE